MNVGTTIYRLREREGITQAELGNRADISRCLIAKYESGAVKTIPYDKLERIARALNVRPQNILGWELA